MTECVFKIHIHGAYFDSTVVYCFSGCWYGCWAGRVISWWRRSVWRQNRVAVTSSSSRRFPGPNTKWSWLLG